MSDLDDDLSLALQLADVADGLTLARFRALDLVVDTKPDLTPVSDVDRAAERALQEELASRRPDHGVLGEEFGERPGEGKWRWLLDPIDGTRNYVKGIPVWGTLITLEFGGEPVIGVVSAPALGRRWWATRRGGAFADGAPIRVSAVSSVADSNLAYDSVVDFDRAGLLDSFLALARRSWRTRAFTDFWSHMLVAEGGVDAALNAQPGAKVWDLAPLQVIVEEAGGRFSDLQGAQGAGGGTALSSNGLLHEEVLAALHHGRVGPGEV